MLLAVKKIKEINTPFVFDPAGVGASKYRTETALNIIATAAPNVIRGNASEIMVWEQQASKQAVQKGWIAQC
jgi:hydroxyethylthiazole kinase